jgi:hypothetical protein
MSPILFRPKGTKCLWVRGLTISWSKPPRVMFTIMCSHSLSVWNEIVSAHFQAFKSFSSPLSFDGNPRCRHFHSIHEPWNVFLVKMLRFLKFDPCTGRCSALLSLVQNSTLNVLVCASAYLRTKHYWARCLGITYSLGYLYMTLKPPPKIFWLLYSSCNISRSDCKK